MDLINRLKFYMDSIGVPISQFADNCGIPRPSMSQLLNGRNKRISDDVINKIHNTYPDLSILWLMFGEGEMLKNKNIEISEPQNGVDNSILERSAPETEADTDMSEQKSAFPDKMSDISYADNSLFGEVEQGVPQSQNDTIVSQRENISFGAQTTSANPGATAEGAETGKQANFSSTNSHQPSTTQSMDITHTVERECKVSITPDSTKKITNIVVFYSDNSFQSFIPDA